MSNNKDFKIIKIRERVYKEVLKSNKDLTTLRAYMVKKKIIESGNKFDKAILMLKNEGRIFVKNGYAMANPSDLKKATFFSSGKYKYVVIDGDNSQYEIREEDSEGYKSHMRVQVAFTDDGKYRHPFIVSRLGDDEELVENAPPVEDETVVLGRVVKLSHDELIFIPSDKRFTKNITILNQKNTLSSFQDKICLLKIARKEENGLPASGFITEVKGDAGNPIHEYQAIAEQSGAIMSWENENVAKEIEKIPDKVDLSDKMLVNEEGEVIQNGNEKIVDLRDLGFSTVDPATCKDMDDAIYSTYDENGNLVVYTAVANVTKYVDLKSEIGKLYVKGAFTTYAPNRAYNILPPQLSTGICSLNPNEDRLALVIKTVIDENTGLPISSQIMDGVINSKEKYSYQQAQKILDESEISLEELKGKAVKKALSKDEQVVLNAKAAEILWKGFKDRNLIRFETKDEYEVEFNSDFSDIIDIKPEDNCFYHKVIEAFMLTANEAAAQFTVDNNIPNIYRVHEMPNEDRVEQANEFFSNINVAFDGDLSPLGIEKVLSSVRGTNKEKMVNNFLVRMQSKARYSTSLDPNKSRFVRKGRKEFTANVSADLKKAYDESFKNMENISHFGLQSKAYSHTTSPIRRLPDYVTHYNILAFINEKDMIDESEVAEIANWANDVQLVNKNAEREFNEVNSAIYCENHIGDVMQGYVRAFKKISPLGTGIENIAVIIENEEKGIRVILPAEEIIQKNAKNVTISPFGSALIDRESKKPLLKLCEEISFKIKNADRVTREVNATTDLEKENFEDENNEFSAGFVKQSSNPRMAAKKQKMLSGIKFEREKREKRLASEKTIIDKSGKEISPKKSYQYERKQRIDFNNKKLKEVENSYSKEDF